MPLLKEGQNIRDTYEVERFLGEGAFAEVYRVKHRFLGRQAIKIFKRYGMELKEIEEMLGEAILLSRIGHPNIIRVFDANIIETEKGICGYFTMENISGGSLDRFWCSHGNNFIPINTTIDILKQICRGLSIAHLENPPIIHRDIKPQNILIGYETDGLRARVSDFGLAKKVNPLTLLATSAGTLSFKPPEAFSKSKGDSCAGDVWGLGTTFYLLLTDQLPYIIDSSLGWDNKKVFDKAISPPSQYNILIDSTLESIVMKCLKKNPIERYKNAKDLLDALDSWKPSRPVNIVQSNNHQTSEKSKSVLGTHSPVNHDEGEKLVKKAFYKARVDGKLLEAADLMEEALNKSPSLRGKYAPQVKLWRCGISM